MKTPSLRTLLRPALAAALALSVFSSSLLRAADPATALARCTELLNSGKIHGTTAPTSRDAATALGLLGGEPAVAALSARYKIETDKSTRLIIVRSLGQLRLASALPTLEAAANDDYPLVPKTAARSVSAIKGTPPLQGYARGRAFSPDANSTDAVLERCTKTLIYGTDNPSSSAWASKREAAITLGLLGDERAVPVLTDQLLNAEVQQLRLEIVRALGWIGSRTAVPALEQALNDPYVHVRKYSSEVLQQITGHEYPYDKTGEAEGRQRVKDLIEIRRTVREMNDLELDSP